MKLRIFLLILGAGLLLGSSSIAIHYKQQAANLHSRLQASGAQEEILRSDLITSMQKLKLAEMKATESVAPDEGAEPMPGERPEADALRRQVQDLQRQLAAVQTVTPAAVAEADANEKTPEEPQQWNRRGQWLEELKESDPDRYEKVMADHQKRKDRMHQSFADKSDFFLDRDLSEMSDSDVETYNHMLTLIHETWGLAEQIDREDIPGEERRDLRQQMRENMRELNPLLVQERRIELYELGLSVGYDHQGAEAFASYIESVFDVTSMRAVWRGLRGGPRPPRDRNTDRPPADRVNP